PAHVCGEHVIDVARRAPAVVAPVLFHDGDHVVELSAPYPVGDDMPVGTHPQSDRRGRLVVGLKGAAGHQHPIRDVAGEAWLLRTDHRVADTRVHTVGADEDIAVDAAAV